MASLPPVCAITFRPGVWVEVMATTKFFTDAQAQDRFRSGRYPAKAPRVRSENLENICGQCIISAAEFDSNALAARRSRTI